jgi:hypothetical protein
MTPASGACEGANRWPSVGGLKNTARRASSVERDTGFTICNWRVQRCDGEKSFPSSGLPEPAFRRRGEAPRSHQANEMDKSALASKDTMNHFTTTALRLARAAAALISCATASCSASSTESTSDPTADRASGAPSATLTGSIGGHTLVVEDVFTFIESSPFNMKTEIADYRGACAVWQRPADRANSTRLVLQTFGTMGDGTGAYAVTASKSGSGVTGSHITFKKLDPTCNSSLSIDADSGYVKITQITATKVAGTYAATFGSDSISGAFSSAICDDGESGATTCD